MLVIGVPLVVFLLYLLFDESFVRIEPGKLGLLLVKGRATDKTLLPGPHWVPSLRRMSTIVYPSLELSYRAGDDTEAEAPGSPENDELERRGPVLAVTFGDRAAAAVSYTVRFRLEPAQLRTIHERFGPGGLWGIVRDEADRTVAGVLADPSHTIEDLFGTRRADLQAALAVAVSEALAGDGFQLTLFHLRRVDLGRSGEEIQGAVRARYEFEREQAEAATRLARVRNDAELAPYVAGGGFDTLLRYRETDLWRDVAQRPEGVSLVLPAPTSTGTAAAAAVSQQAEPSGGAAEALPPPLPPSGQP